MPDDIYDLYFQACDKVDRGDIKGARKLLKGHPQFLIGLERKIRPDTEEGRIKELERLAKLASVHRGRAWAYQLEATQVCRYSRTLLKDDVFRLSDFLERQTLTRDQQSKLHSKFFDLYFAEVATISRWVRAQWKEYSDKKPEGIRFKDFVQIKALIAPQEFNSPPKTLNRYERPWVI